MVTATYYYGKNNVPLHKSPHSTEHIRKERSIDPNSEYTISIVLESAGINEDSFELDFNVPYTYFSIDNPGYFKINILGNTITRIDKVTIDLSGFKGEKYILTIEIGENNDRNIR